MNNAGSRPKSSGMLTHTGPNKKRYERQTRGKPGCFRCKSSAASISSKGHASHWEAVVFLTGFGVLLGCLLGFPCQQIQRKAFRSGIGLSCKPAFKRAAATERIPPALDTLPLPLLLLLWLCFVDLCASKFYKTSVMPWNLNNWIQVACWLRNMPCNRNILSLVLAGDLCCILFPPLAM